MLFYYWTPEWVHAAYDLTPIAEPATYDGCLDKMDLAAEDWLEVSEFDCASANATIYVAYSKSLEERNPAVANFLSNFALDPATVNQWILQIGRDEEDPVDVAEAWVEANMDIVNTIDTSKSIQSYTIPTVDTISCSYLMRQFMSVGHSPLLVGQAGCGKTQMIKGLLKELVEKTDDYLSQVINMNYYTDATTLRLNLMTQLEKQGGTRYGPVGKYTLIYFIDDLNMP